MTEFQFPYIFKFSFIALCVCLCLARRFLSDLVKDSGDEFDATLMAIKCLDSNEFYPPIKTYNGQVGYLYYPQLLYYFAASIVDVKFITFFFSWLNSPKLFLIFNKFDLGAIFPSYTSNQLSRISRFIFLLKLISGYFLPFLLLGLIGLVGLIKFDNSLLTMLFIVVSIILADQSLAHPGYSISGRNIGGVLYGLFYLSLICLPQSITTNSGLNSSVAGFSDNEVFLGVLNGLSIDHLLMLILLVVMPLLFLSSQRGTQLLFSLLISLSVVSFKFIPITAIAAILSTFFLLQFPRLNYGRAFWVHFANRLHQYKWSQKTYGNFRFKLIILRGKAFSAWINDAIFFKYVTNYITPDHPYEKTNFLSIFLVHRIFIFSALILCFPLDSFGISNSHILLLKIIVFSSLIPSILIVFKPFQGYGSSEIYITGNLPYCYISILPILLVLLDGNYFSYEQNNFLIGIISLILIDVLGIVIRWSNSTFQLALSSKKYLSFAFISRLFDVYKYHRLCSSVVLDIFKQLPDKASISILTPEIHLFTFCEAISNYIGFIYPSKILNVPFQMIDNFNYGFYEDMNSFAIDSSAISKINPDIILLDIRRPTSKYIFMKFLSKHDSANCFLLKNDGPLVLLSFNGKLRTKSI